MVPGGSRKHGTAMAKKLIRQMDERSVFAIDRAPRPAAPERASVVKTDRAGMIKFSFFSLSHVKGRKSRDNQGLARDSDMSPGEHMGAHGRG